MKYSGMAGKDEGKQTFYVVGKRLDGLDEKAKVAGSVVYADDFTTERMLHAKVFRSTRASAKIKSIDTTAARNLPGVVIIITAEDVPNNRSVTSAVARLLILVWCKQSIRLSWPRTG